MKITAVALTLAAAAALAFAADPPEGLQLELASKTTSPIQPGETIEFELKVVNRSTTLTHKVVRPNDGSDAGWREPHVFWTATFIADDGAERRLEANGGGRCGLFANEWWKDVTSLPPGAEMPVEWINRPGSIYDIQEDGKLRLVAHYAWQGGINRTGTLEDVKAPSDLGGMKGVEPYELVSKPMEVTYRRKFELVVRPTAKFKAGREVRLSAVVEAAVKSLSEQALRFDPSEWQVTILNDPKVAQSPEQRNVASEKQGEALDLAAGGAVTVVGNDARAFGMDVSVKFTTSGRARIALLMQRVTGGGPRIRSNWIDVDVEE